MCVTLREKGVMFRNRLFKSVFAALTAALLVLNINLSASAVTPVSNFKVVTGYTSAKLTWTKFTAGRVSSIQVVSQIGTKKTIKTLAATATTYTFTRLDSYRTYSFKVTGYKGTRIVASSTLSVKTKKILLYNSIFFGQPKDMVLGDENQLLFALPNGGVVTFRTTTPTVCEIVDTSYVKALNIGDCVVVASDVGDADYGPAQDETRSFSISASIESLNPELLWADEFGQTAGSGPNPGDWSVTLGDGCGTAAGCGWGNSEKQSYATCALKQNGSAMVITASTVAGDPNCTSNKSWTSGKFISKGKREFTYGYFESRMKMPEGEGAWPAFWLLGSNIDTVPWPRCGEIDIMEYTGNAPFRSTSAAHYANNIGIHAYKSGAATASTEYFNDFHTYGLLWLPNELTFYVDGKVSFKLNKSDTGLTIWPFGPNSSKEDPKMYLIFNLAMGGNYGGSVPSSLTKAQTSIDYVRYYKVSGYGKVFGIGNN